jgi:hypothetical protein
MQRCSGHQSMRTPGCKAFVSLQRGAPGLCARSSTASQHIASQIRCARTARSRISRWLSGLAAARDCSRCISLHCRQPLAVLSLPAPLETITRLSPASSWPRLQCVFVLVLPRGRPRLRFVGSVCSEIISMAASHQLLASDFPSRFAAHNHTAEKTVQRATPFLLPSYRPACEVALASASGVSAALPVSWPISHASPATRRLRRLFAQCRSGTCRIVSKMPIARLAWCWRLLGVRRPSP